VVGEHLAGAGNKTHHTVKDAPRVPVIIHAELEKMAQKTPALRDAKGERVADASTVGPHALGDQRVRRALAVCLVRWCLPRTRS
jgi:hypothetical protein